MTTIIFAEGKLLADSRATNDNEIYISPAKKIHLPEEGDYWEVMGNKAIAFAIAGDTADIEHIKDLLRKGLNHRSELDRVGSSSSAVILDEMGRAYIFTGVVRPNSSFSQLLQILPPLAIGSGASYALAILSLGKSPELAMKIASKLDAYTGGEIQEFILPPPPAVKSTRPKPEQPPVVEQTAQSQQ